MSRYRALSLQDDAGEHFPMLPSKAPATSASQSVLPPISQTQPIRHPKQAISFFLRTWVVGTVIVAMVLLAIGVEVALYRSEKYQGWNIHGIQLLGRINFTKSVAPVILTAPITIFWTQVDRSLGLYHPYVILSRGRAPANKSLLLDYTRGRLSTIMRSLSFRHWTVFLSSLLCLANLALSPLSAGILTTHNTMVTMSSVQIDAVKSLGLDPDYVTLEYFDAAAGYSQAAAINNLTNPPFLFKGSWALAEFKIPATVGNGVNETVVVPTTGIESTAGCQSADTTNLDSNVPLGTNMTITGTWDNCTVTFAANNTGSDGYGVLPLVNCATHPEPAPVRPVIFWMYSAELNQVELTFCQPTIAVWNVVAEASLVTREIVNVTLIDQNVPPNNITGAPLNGVPFNGIEFDLDGANKYVLARALSIQAGVAGAVYRGADQYGGASVVMQSPNGFLNITENVYNSFLSLVAKQTYFNDFDSTIVATLNSSEVRLAVVPLAAHAFASALTFIALMATIVHLNHRRERKHTYLACEPTTIAGILSTASQSKFTAALQSGMDEKEISAALRGTLFRINQRTWRIEAVGDEEDYVFGRRPPLESHAGKRASIASYDSGNTANDPFSPPLMYTGKS